MSKIYHSTMPFALKLGLNHRIVYGNWWVWRWFVLVSYCNWSYWTYTLFSLLPFHHVLQSLMEIFNRLQKAFIIPEEKYWINGRCKKISLV